MSLLAILAGAALAACPFADPSADPAAYLRSADRAEVEAALTCLGHPDPDVRDRRAYGGFFATLRDGTFPADLRGDLGEALARQMAEKDAEGGFAPPFAALVMSELARTDRIEPWLGEADLARLVAVASNYLAGVDDYRGFSPEDGWRHGVAHGADLMMQLALNPRIDSGMARQMLAAIAVQVAPRDHAYRFAEPYRLARPVIYLAGTEALSEQEWEAWLAALYPSGEAADAGRYHDLAALNRMHNVRAFALEISQMASRQGGSPALALHDEAAALLRLTAG